ncbi:hypothetical protein KKF91_15240, partial [Myxococcota bacterium]|nr:hypothetical protein [Myxococcota bacterium]
MDEETPVGTLAVDLGLRLGLAYFQDARLLWARSQHIGDRARLKRAIPGILASARPLHRLICEGDAQLARLWCQAAAREGAVCQVIGAEVWREEMLWARQRRSGAEAKRAAQRLAREIMAASGLKPTSLRHDAAEAVLIGAWALR